MKRHLKRLLEASAPTYKKTKSDGSYTITLTDANHTLSSEWGRDITVTNANGLTITVTDDSMTITGDPTSSDSHMFSIVIEYLL